MAKYNAYPEYKESGIECLGEIPALWKISAIKHVAQLNPSKSSVTRKQMKEMCSFIPMEKLKFNFIATDEIKAVSAVYNGYTYFENNDILIAKVTPCFENKNMVVAGGLYNGLGFGSSEIYVLRCNNAIDNKFLFYRLQEDNFMSIAEGAMVGAGGLKRVPSDVLNTFKFGLPNKKEQLKIVDFLDNETAKIDKLIEKQQQLIERLKEKRMAVISHAVTKGLNPDVAMKDSGVEWLGEVPQHWNITKGGYIGRLFGSETVSESNISDEGGLPFIKVSTLSLDSFTLNEPEWFIKTLHEKKYKSECDYIAFPKRGAAIFTNKVNVVRMKSIIDPNLMGWKMNSGVSDEYIAFVLKKRGLSDIADVSTVPQINNKHISPEKFPLPPYKEQLEIVDYLKVSIYKFDNLIDTTQKTIEFSQERRIALISAAVTGKIDVRDWVAPITQEVKEPQETTV